MRCKVILGQDTRSWRYPPDNRYNALQSFITQTFSSLTHDTVFFVQYQDDENDFVTISSEKDLEEAFVLARSEKRKSLKLYVQTGSVENLHRAESVATMSVRSFPHSPRSVLKDASGISNTSSEFEILVENRSSELEECSVITEKKEEEVSDAEESDNEEVVKSDADIAREEIVAEEEEPSDWRSLLKKFLEETKEVHKSALEMFYSELKEGKTTLAGAIESVFNSFEQLSNHQIIQNVGGVEVVCEMARMCNGWTPVLIQLGCENVESVLGEFIEAAIENMLENDGSTDVCVDVGPLFKRLFPQFYDVLEERLAKSHGKDVTVDLTEVFQANDAKGVAQAMVHASNTKRNDEEDEMESEAIHNGVICDICNMNPIKGPRFKCAIRPNYDLCEKCEASRNVEDRQYPMIKIKVPVKNIVGTYRFIGANEFCRQSKQAFRDYRWDFRRGAHPHPHPHPVPPHRPPMGHPPFFPPWNKGFAPWGHPPHHPPHHGHGQRRGHHGPPPPHHMMRPGWPNFATPEHHGPPPPHHFTSSIPQSPAVSDAGSVRSDMSSIRGSTKKLKANFIEDVTIADRSVHAPNTNLVKTWRMKNTGQQRWGGEEDVETKTRLVFIKGHENLATEKEFEVPKAEPGEEVNVCARLKTPDRDGRYCSYYRLEKDGVKFGPRVWVDLFVKDSVTGKEAKKLGKLHAKSVKIEKKIIKNEEKKAKVISRIQKLKGVQKPEKEFPCICGESNLQKLLAKICYNGEFVHCDLCGLYIDGADFVFHCPITKNSTIHPNGYDVCQKCLKLQLQIEADVDTTPKEPEKPEPKAAPVPEPEPRKPERMYPKLAPKQDVKPPVAEKPVEEELPEPEKPQLLEQPSAPPMPPFQFAEQLSAIQCMGFNDTEAICELLVNHKGNLENVLNILLTKSA